MSLFDIRKNNGSIWVNMSLFDLRELTILIKVSLFVLRGIPIYQRLAKSVPIRNKQSSNTNTI